MNTLICKPKVKSVVDVFSEALIHKDLQTIIEILSDEGEFEIQSPSLNTLGVNKKRFFTWFKKRIKETSCMKITFDQCLHCSLGGTVLLINEGTFPRQLKDSSERSKTGLMLNVKEGQIIQIKFCYVFAKTDNKYAFELRMDRIHRLEDQGKLFGK